MLSHENNASGSYQLECVLREIVTSEGDVEDLVRAYTERHLHTEHDTAEVRRCCQAHVQSR